MHTTKLKFTTKQLYIASLFNFFILIFLGFKYVKYVENLHGFFSYAYLLVSFVGHFFLMNIISLLMALLVLFVFKSSVVSKIIFSLSSILTIIYLQVDTIVFSQFRYHLSPIVFKLVFGKRATDIFQFSVSNVVMAVLFITGIIMVEVLVLFAAKKAALKVKGIKVKRTLGITAVFLLYTHLVFAWSDANRFRAVTQVKNLYPAFFPLTAAKLMKKLNLVDPEELKKNSLLSKQYSKELVKYPLNPIKTEKKGEKNILMIVIDSWRYDCMNEDVSPNMYQFSEKSQLFLNHRSGANMTTGGIFSLFYGIPATYYDQFTGLQIPPVFIEELQKQKYELSILSSATLENPPFNRNVFTTVKNLRVESKGNTPAERDLDVYKHWMNFIDKRKINHPFFSFVFFDAAHGFDYPSNFSIKFKPSLEKVNFLDLNDDYNPDQFINRYKNSVYFLDGLIGNILKKLEEKGLLESTIVVITGDHGQEFNDNKKGYWQHGGNFSKYQINTPLIVYDSSRKPEKYTNMTLHYDIIPTLMNSVLGVTNSIEDYSTGQSLYDNKYRSWFICGYNQRYAVIDKNIIINIYPSGSYEASDLDLNILDDSKIDFNTIKKAVEQNSKFYNKTGK